MSSINTTPHQGVNVGQTPVKTPHNWSLGDEDNDAADSAPNTGTLAGNELLEETGPNNVLEYDVKLHPAVIYLLSSLCRSLRRSLAALRYCMVAMPMTQWEFRIVPCLAGGNASATCIKILVMRFCRCAMTLNAP